MYGCRTRADKGWRFTEEVGTARFAALVRVAWLEGPPRLVVDIEGCTPLS